VPMTSSLRRSAESPNDPGDVRGFLGCSMGGFYANGPHRTRSRLFPALRRGLRIADIGDRARRAKGNPENSTQPPRLRHGDSGRGRRCHVGNERTRLQDGRSVVDVSRCYARSHRVCQRHFLRVSQY